MFGLNPNADLTAALNASKNLIQVLLDTQPSDAGGAGQKTPEQIVKEMIENDFLKMLPDEFKMQEVIDRITAMQSRKLSAPNGMEIPLNIFLFQEIQRFQNIRTIVGSAMKNMVLAIDGQIIMSPELVNSIKLMFDLRVPMTWLYDPSGAEISWLNPTLSGWLSSMVNREYQLRQWLMKDRPVSFWLTGFFNPQGFLTSVRQEITRAHRADKWALDAMVMKTIVAPPKNTLIADDARIEGKQIPEPAEGVWIHGLYLEGAAWNKPGGYLEDMKGKDLFYSFPNITISADCPTAQQGPGNRGPRKDDGLIFYNCPLYKYPVRQDRYLITNKITL